MQGAAEFVEAGMQNQARKLVPEVVARIRQLREDGATIMAIATEVGVSHGSVSIALGPPKPRRLRPVPATHPCRVCRQPMKGKLQRCRGCLDAGREARAVERQRIDAGKAERARVAAAARAAGQAEATVRGRMRRGLSLEQAVQPSARNLARRCSVCGSPALPKRSTCSDACAQRKCGRPAPLVPCSQCGEPFKRKRWAICAGCVASWWTAHREASRVACSVCSTLMPVGWKRATCGDECRHRAMVMRIDASSAVGLRSESKRASRRRQAATRYRGRDKAELVARLTAEQGGRCAVCGSDGHALGDGRHGLVLDHCHRTGRPRAMLCGRCNAALGLLGEDPSRIRQMLAYAERHAAAKGA